MRKYVPWARSSVRRGELTMKFALEALETAVDRDGPDLAAGNQSRRMTWFLKRVFWVWLVLTLFMIGGFLSQVQM
jgi:hypothetical protein